MTPHPHASRFPPMMSITDAREVLGGLADAGTLCPVCEQNVKIYKRKLTPATARAIAALYNEHGRGFGYLPNVIKKHLADVASQGGQLVMGAHWGLIEPREVRRADGGRAGYWRVTELGEQWLHGHVTVPQTAHVFNNRCLDLTGPDTTAAEVLAGSGFDLRELLGPAGYAEPGEAAPLFMDDAQAA